MGVKFYIGPLLLFVGSCADLDPAESHWSVRNVAIQAEKTGPPVYSKEIIRCSPGHIWLASPRGWLKLKQYKPDWWVFSDTFTAHNMRNLYQHINNCYLKFRSLQKTDLHCMPSSMMQWHQNVKMKWWTSITWINEWLLQSSTSRMDAMLPHR
jgi:hypothetical protein